MTLLFTLWWQLSTCCYTKFCCGLSLNKGLLEKFFAALLCSNFPLSKLTVRWWYYRGDFVQKGGKLCDTSSNFPANLTTPLLMSKSKKSGDRVKKSWRKIAKKLELKLSHLPIWVSLSLLLSEKRGWEIPPSWCSFCAKPPYILFYVREQSATMTATTSTLYTHCTLGHWGQLLARCFYVTGFTTLQEYLMQINDPLTKYFLGKKYAWLVLADIIHDGQNFTWL